jgi:hypothetical protein
VHSFLYIRDGHSVVSLKIPHLDNFMPSNFSQLYNTVSAGDFFTLSDTEILLQIHDDFPDELERLKRAYSIRDASAALPKSQSPSHLLYGREYDEVNRTLVGILALRWIHEGDYEAFVGTQQDSIKLRRESFDWIRKMFIEGIEEPADLYALIMSMVINDLGKDPQLASDYQKMSGENIFGVNHDLVLLKAVKIGLVQCLSRLDARHKADIVRGMELGAEFNFGQLAQGENVPACLSGLISMKGQRSAFKSRFMEQLLDIASAAGHMDWTCAKKLIEPIYQAYHNVYDVATGIICENLSLRDGYDIILVRRAELLSKAGYRELDVKKPEDRALMRLLCMGGAADLETAILYNDAYSTLEDSSKLPLIHNLNLDGTIAEPAVQPTYMPAMLSSGTAVAESLLQKKQVLQSLMRYLARVLTVAKKPSEPISVIERNVRETLKDVLDSEAFKADPDILEKLAVPRDETAKMREEK